MSAGDAGQALTVVIVLAAICYVAAKAIARRSALTEAEFLREWNATHRSRRSIVPLKLHYGDEPTTDEHARPFALDYRDEQP